VADLSPSLADLVARPKIRVRIQRTRLRQAAYFREVVEDLLKDYEETKRWKERSNVWGSPQKRET